MLGRHDRFSSRRLRSGLSVLPREKSSCSSLTYWSLRHRSRSAVLGLFFCFICCFQIKKKNLFQKDTDDSTYVWAHLRRSFALVSFVSLVFYIFIHTVTQFSSYFWFNWNMLLYVFRCVSVTCVIFIMFKFGFSNSINFILEVLPRQDILIRLDAFILFCILGWPYLKIFFRLSLSTYNNAWLMYTPKHEVKYIYFTLFNLFSDWLLMLGLTNK